MVIHGAEECRSRARKCRDEATRVFDPAVRQQMRDLADHWESMARDIENIARMRKALTAEDMIGRGV